MLPPSIFIHFNCNIMLFISETILSRVGFLFPVSCNMEPEAYATYLLMKKY